MFQQHFANIINALRQGVAQSPAIATWFVRSCRVWLILSLTFLSAWSYAAAPVTSITSPAANTKFIAPASITINANATNAAGATITKVQFYQGTTLLGTSTTAPYRYTWTNVAAGSYSLTVKATNSLNQVTTSAAVPIVVNNIPTVSLTSPAANTSVAGKATVTLSATASDTGGSIAKVEFFNGSTLIATDTTSPYSYSWTGVAPGTYTITAKATDNLGDTKTTASVTLTVTNPLTTSVTAPANNAVFTSGAAITVSANAATTKSGTTISKVEFYQGSTLIGSDTTSPYSISWTGAALGTYSVTAKVTDSQGLTQTSSPITVKVQAAAPTISLTSPANNASFVAPANISLTANATANGSGNSISKVEYFQGTSLIATSTAAPFSASWANVAAGTYRITAKATDAQGLTTTSVAATIKVNAPPTISITSPANNTSFAAPANITYTVNAAAIGAGNSITKVEYFNGATLLASSTTAPFSISSNNVQAGTYTITAKATDANGLTQTSSPVTVKVNGAPTISITSPANNASFAAPANITYTVNAAAIGAGNSISKVEYFNGATLLASSTTAPFSISSNNVQAGTYTITAKATDANGLTQTSSPITVKVNSAPTISITSPANNASFAAPANITYTVNAAATGAGNNITKVEYFNGATLLASSTTAPFSISSNNVQAGTYTITAKATDANGLTQTSSPITVKVNAPPTISITSPTNNSSFTAPANITYTVNAAAIGAGNSITKVEYFNGATLLASSTTAPFSISSNNVQAGTYTITAKATDANGLTQTSSPITVKVNSLPTISLTSPAANANFIAPASITLTSTPATPDAGVSISKVEYFQDANLIATSTTAPFNATWENVVAGSYNISAKVTDSNNNSVSSAPVAISVINNTAPTVSVTVNPAAATAPATLIIAATANDTDGSVAKVELFNGANLIATLTTAPYTYQWTNVAEGSYTISAKATDNLGASTTSSSVAVNVAARQAQIYDIHADHLGTPRMVTDASGNSVWEWISTPFGESLPNQNPQNVVGKEFVMNLRFPGQVFDEETGLHYNYFRDYDPKTGRYVESDPIGLSGGMNTFGYVGGNPTNGVDDFGLCVSLFCIPGITNKKLVSSKQIDLSKWELENVHSEPPIMRTGTKVDTKAPKGGLFKGAESGMCFFARYRTFKDVYELHRQIACYQVCYDGDCSKNMYSKWTVYDELGIEEKIRRERETFVQQSSAAILFLKCLDILGKMN